MTRARSLTSGFVALTVGAAAFFLLAPARSSYAFTKISGTLGVFTQRDWRVFDNFLDASANANATADPNFPGWLGAELAIWKGAVEWGADPFGDGSGDPTQVRLGDGGANFDFVFSGRTIAAGNQNANVMTGEPVCGLGGTLAYTIVPTADGWKTRFCDEFTWSDAPGGPLPGQFDLQGVACHEFGHALGLGHSAVSGATMVGTTPNGLTYRSIEADDRAGLQCFYNVRNPNKVTISGVSVDQGNGLVTVTGTNFTATDNEVWLTNGTATASNDDPRVIVSGLASTGGGTQLVFAIPSAAVDGELHVKADDVGGKSLSSGWPIALGAPPGGGPLQLLGLSPTQVPALVPGTDQTVQITGAGFSPASSVQVDGVALPVGSYTYVDPNTITFDMPLSSSVGLKEVRVVDGGQSVTSMIDVVFASSLVLQCGTGDPLNEISGTFDVCIAGDPNDLHFVVYSGSNAPSKFLPFACLDIGNNFSDFFELGRWTVDPVAGVTCVTLPLPALTATFYLQSLTLSQGLPVADSNVQSVQLVP